MNKYVPVLFIMITAFVSTGCETMSAKPIQALNVASSLVVLNENYDLARDILLDQCSELNEQDCQSLTKEIESIGELKLRIEKIVQDQSFSDLAEIDRIYDRAKISYFRIKDKVESIELTNEQAYQLKAYDSNIQNLSRNLTGLLTHNNVDYKSAGIMIIQILSQAAKVAAVL